MKNGKIQLKQILIFTSPKGEAVLQVNLEDLNFREPPKSYMDRVASNHYQALTNTFLKNYETAESLFQSNIDYGTGSYQRQALGFMGNLHVFAGDFDRAIEALDNYINIMPNLELPRNSENYTLANVHFNKFLCYSHNQQENESLEEINSYINYRN